MLLPLLLLWSMSVHSSRQEDTKIPHIKCHGCSVKGASTSTRVLKDDLAKDAKGSERNLISNQNLPYIVLPPDNVLPENPKAILYQGTTAPHEPSLLHATPTAAPHTSARASPPKPVNINIILPTASPKPTTPPPSIIHGTVNPHNETRIDLNLNIEEQNHQPIQQPIVIKLAPTTPIPRVIVPQRQQAIASQIQASIGQALALPQPYGVLDPYAPARMPPVGTLTSDNLLGRTSLANFPQPQPYGVLDPYAPARMPPVGTLTSENFLGRTSLANFPNQGFQVPPYTTLGNPIDGLSNADPRYSNPQMLDRLSLVISSAIKSSIVQSQPELITSALTNAAIQTQTQRQPSELLTGALTQALANVVGQNKELSEEQKLTKNLAAALNMLKNQASPTQSLPVLMGSKSPLKVEVINLPNQNQPANPGFPFNFANQNQPINPGYPFNPANAGNPIYSASAPQISGYYPNPPQPLFLGQIPREAPQSLPTKSVPLPQQDSHISIDKVSANALGKAMAKALVDTAKKVVSDENSGIQRDIIFKSKNLKGIPKQLTQLFQNTIFRNRHLGHRSQNHRRLGHRLQNHRRLGHRFGPVSVKYLRNRGKHRCCYCSC